MLSGGDSRSSDAKNGRKRAGITEYFALRLITIGLEIARGTGRADWCAARNVLFNLLIEWLDHRTVRGQVRIEGERE